MNNPYAAEPKPKVERLSVTVPPHLVAWVKAEAKKHNVTVSRVVEVALMAYRDRDEAEAKPVHIRRVRIDESDLEVVAEALHFAVSGQRGLGDRPDLFRASARTFIKEWNKDL